MYSEVLFVIFLVSSTSERPLKYETTRPISAKHETYLKTKKGTFVTDTYTADDCTLDNASFPSPPSLSTPHMVYPTERDFHLHDLNSTVLETGPDSNRIASSRLRPPNSVVQFDKDMSSMSALERELKENAIVLQRQLGISENAIVF